ncbi:hypothetical protein, partial [Planctomicrobium piriforme]|uniref:hypothetical protein n=1 Tax=Planctomicrobium piriforme TaxID=1576369 RepID=UPI001C315694
AKRKTALGGFPCRGLLVCAWLVKVAQERVLRCFEELTQRKWNVMSDWLSGEPDHHFRHTPLSRLLLNSG